MRTRVAGEVLLGAVEVGHDEAVHGVERCARVAVKVLRGCGLLHYRHRDAVASELRGLVVEGFHARLLVFVEAREVEIEHGAIAVTLAKVFLGGIVAALDRLLAYADDVVGVLYEVVVIVVRVIVGIAQRRAVLGVYPVVVAIVAHGEVGAQQVAHVHLAGISPVLGIVSLTVGVPRGEERGQRVGEVFERLAVGGYLSWHRHVLWRGLLDAPRVAEKRHRGSGGKDRVLDISFHDCVLLYVIRKKKP